MIQQLHSWAYIQKKMKTLICKDTYIPVFIATLFTISLGVEVSINRWMYKKYVVYLYWYNELLPIHKKE